MLPTPTDPERAMLAVGSAQRPLAYTDEGPRDAPIAAVMVHGAPGSVRDFRYVAPPVCAGGVRVVRLDLPGFGRSPRWGPEDVQTRTRAACVVDAVEALGLERVVVVGHSLGGAVAIAAAERAPERVAGVALICSVGLRPHRASLPRNPIPSAIIRWALARRGVMQRLTAPLVRRIFVLGGFSSRLTYAAMAQTFACADALDFEQHAARVRRMVAPALVAWADDDPLIEPEIARALADACPPGRRLGFADGGHNPQKPHAQVIGESIAAWALELAA